MTWETKLERDALADDRDRLWGAWPAGCGAVETSMSNSQTYQERNESLEQALAAKDAAAEQKDGQK